MVAAICALAIIDGLVFVVDRPSLTLDDPRYTITGCPPSGTDFGRIDWIFGLTNTGMADGIATVRFLLDGQSMGEQSYFIASGRSVRTAGTVFGSDGGPAPCTYGAIPTAYLSSVVRA